MKLRDKISWLMGRVQRSLFPHLNQCFASPLTEQEERLVSILEILQIERHVPRTISHYRNHETYFLEGYIDEREKQKTGQ